MEGRLTGCPARVYPLLGKRQGLGPLIPPCGHRWRRSEAALDSAQRAITICGRRAMTRFRPTGRFPGTTLTVLTPRKPPAFGFSKTLTASGILISMDHGPRWSRTIICLPTRWLMSVDAEIPHQQSLSSGQFLYLPQSPGPLPASPSCGSWAPSGTVSVCFLRLADAAV